jgi:primosomal protein N' (replication factor Y)
MSDPRARHQAQPRNPAPSADQVPSPLLADVLVPRRLSGPFTYAVPEPLRTALRPGSLVLVPFGPASAPAVVVEVGVAPSAEAGTKTLRTIRALLDESPDRPALPEELLALTGELARIYLAPRGQCVRLVLPADPGRRRPARAKAAAPGRPDGGSGPAAPPIVLERPAPPSGWWRELERRLDARRHDTLLCVGRAAARWAILLEAVGATLNWDRPALIIVPERAAAVALADLARARWGDAVALWHGRLPPAARAALWWRIRRGAVRVVIGTRSAVFTPLASIGLIGLDDEGDPSLKEEQAPRYHAREVARLRASRHQALLLVTSAHPSLETSRAVPPAATADLSAGATRPTVEVVDLRTLPPGTLLSPAMVEGLRAAVDAGTGALLFLNRKGFAPALLCRDCGEAPLCPRCSVSLTFYRRAGRLGCHYCGASLALPDACPSCLAPKLEPVGFGTERIEAELRREFPRARILRLDRESARTPAQAEALRRQAAAREVEILVGTQMVFQGPPLPPLGFVGLPLADAGLHLPDFRAAERLYHLLLDAVSLARPAAEGGRVLLQTLLPQHQAIAAVIHDDPARFIEPELAFRRALGYPPFAALIALHVAGRDERKVQTAAERWAALLAASGSPALHLLGPIPAAVAVARGMHRRQLLVKSEDREAARAAVEASLDRLRRESGRGLRLEVDVDPVEMA